MQFQSFSIWLNSQKPEDLLHALRQIPVSELPLKELAQYSGVFDQQSLKFSVLTTTFKHDQASARLSLFYQEFSNPCACSGDDAETIQSFCELSLTVDLKNHTVTLRNR
mgnify:CR=1 FL=1